MIKRKLLSLFLALVNVTRTHAAAFSPEVHADRIVTFRRAAPKATDVTLTCDWLDGAQKLTKADETNWSVTLGPLAPSTYIDGGPKFLQR